MSHTIKINNIVYTVSAEMASGINQILQEAVESSYAPVTPILITEDGINIVDKMQLVYVVNNWTWNTIDVYAKEANQYRTWKVYSTQEARTEYILMNKPLFSISDLQEIDEGRDTERVLISETSLRIQASIKLAENK